MPQTTPSSQSSHHGHIRIKTGLGATLQYQSVNGQWSAQERKHHINFLEMLAVDKALMAFQNSPRATRVCVQIDNNKTAVAYLAKEGGTNSRRLSQLACQILLRCHRHNIFMRPVYVKGE
ncbi:hypothetical protein ACOMHN_020246 [Nucella lapillus]